MGLFGKRKEEKLEAKGGGVVEPLNSNSSELQDLLAEFRQMRSGLSTEPKAVEEVDAVSEEVHTGEEYEVSEEESESIENFLSGTEEPIEEVEVEEEIEEIEEEPIEESLSEEVIDEEVEDANEAEMEEVVEEPEEVYLEEDEVVAEPEEPIEEVEIEEEVQTEEEVIEEPIEEEALQTDNEMVDEVEDWLEESETVEEERKEQEEEVFVPEIEEENKQEAVPSVTNEEIDKKFDEFEKRLLDKIMQQFAVMQMAQPVQPVNQPSEQVVAQPAKVVDEDDIQVSTVNGNLCINGFVFTGEVVMFTPLDNIRKATWEEVVRRKGHCTYHLTTSGNGGWFIKKSNAPNPFAYIENREEAEELAKFYAKKEKAELKIHNAKGVIEKSLSFGREKLRG